MLSELATVGDKGTTRYAWKLIASCLVAFVLCVIGLAVLCSNRLAMHPAAYAIDALAGKRGVISVKPSGSSTEVLYEGTFARVDWVIDWLRCRKHAVIVYGNGSSEEVIGSLASKVARLIPSEVEYVKFESGGVETYLWRRSQGGDLK